jgi:hypothetical protein
VRNWKNLSDMRCLIPESEAPPLLRFIFPQIFAAHTCEFP